ncbi:hypothetical protein BWQ96_08848 [Gracilariopsis chorda]|uniref:Uncharacterized protein n=1 Tax=Gracilariopsis chorda TaxID=448386 RepID=A0A2V3IHB8_9FLOR|nr:hypothetical protein BWQ96_08848 [Gracilariopsis chorda]|eukprot:PXF41467.1 hypothetical protein BWQ96_08848 [Gracilariopsis chorda]
MTNPRAVRGAVALSIATTGGALYYYMSDGGNPENLDHTVENVRGKLMESLHAIEQKGQQIASSAQEALKFSGNNNKQVEANNDEDFTVDKNEDAEQSRTTPEDPAYCHTCSGARIWVFAEKLRLARLLGRQTEPPRDCN